MTTGFALLACFRPRLNHATVVAYLALFVALGGGAYAVTALPKNSVGTKQLKKNAVVSSKIKNGSISGADVSEGTLGTVPTASYAGIATNAGLLQGNPPSAFVSASRVVSSGGIVLLNRGQSKSFATGPFTLTYQCGGGSSGDAAMTLHVTSSAPVSLLNGSSSLGTGMKDNIDEASGAAGIKGTNGIHSFALSAPSSASLTGEEIVGVFSFNHACWGQFVGVT